MIAHKLRRSVAVSVAEARVFARDAGFKRLRAEALTADIDIRVSRAVAHSEAVQDLVQGRIAADKYAKRWELKAVGETVEEAAEAANEDTDGRLKQIAVTESAEAFNETRLYEARAAAAADPDLNLYRRWDAKADACPECADLDGTIVGIEEDFPGGEPGSIHASCQCDFELLTAEEAGESPRFNPDNDEGE